MGDILHMSIRPEPRYCPSEANIASSGIPKMSESSRDWIRNITEKTLTLRINLCGLSGAVKKWANLNCIFNSFVFTVGKQGVYGLYKNCP